MGAFCMRAETVRAKRAWADYLAMGPERSLSSLAERYWTARTQGVSVPTVRLMTLADWSRHFDWQARLKQIADDEAKAAEEREAAYRREVMESGYAVAHERVVALKRLAVQLLDELEKQGKLWVLETRSLGKNGTVDLEKFNAAEVEQFRGLLDDIAREKGERRDKSDVNLTGGIVVNWVPWRGKVGA